MFHHVTNIYLNFSGIFTHEPVLCKDPSSDKPYSMQASVVKSFRMTTPSEICSVPTKSAKNKYHFKK